MRPQLKKKLLFDSEHISRIHSKKSTVPADSPEILYMHYTDKILLLQTQLNKLNLLEHPCEIQSVCVRIIGIKKKISLLAEKYKTLKTTQPVSRFI